jgi:Zn finger protein HypA/HybF involved in hydrogenase expression
MAWTAIKGKIKCEMCGKEVKRISTTQKFCVGCGKKNKKLVDDKRADRLKKERIERNKIMPAIICVNCDSKIQLDFQPMEDYKKFRSLICPYCNKKAI